MVKVSLRHLHLAGGLALLGPSAASAMRPTPQAGDWVIVSAKMAADLTVADGAAVVRIEYVLEGGRPGASIPLQLLGFGAATTEGVFVEGWGDVVLWPASGSLRVASLAAPDDESGAAFPLVIPYQIERAVDGTGFSLHARVPLAVVPLPTASGVSDPFEARLRLPPGWRFSEGFPSGLRLGDGGDQVTSLAVIPSVVSFRARTDGVWRPGLPFAVNLLMATIMTVFGWIGWRHLRRIAA